MAVEDFAPLAHRYPGAELLGHTQQQGGSVLQAGARALLIRSPVTKALSTMRGRIAAQTMITLGANQQMLNYAAFRPYAMMEAIRRHAPQRENAVIVDPAGGYSPQFAWLAGEMLKTRFIEVDTPGVIADKQTRLKDFGLPDNLSFLSADLSRVALHQVLPVPRVDLVMALGAYITHLDYARLLLYLRRVLADDGLVLAAFPYAPGIADLAQHSVIFRRVAGNPLGVVEGQHVIESIFAHAGYTLEATYLLSELAQAMNKPVPADIEVIAVARR